MIKAQAAAILKNAIPKSSRIGLSIDYKNFYVFQVFSVDPDEGSIDPFMSVDKVTKKVEDFPLFAHSPNDVLDLFEKEAGL